MKLFPGSTSLNAGFRNLRFLKQREIRKEERRANEGPIFISTELLQEAGISGNPAEKFCEIQYMISQTLKENVIPQIQAGGPVGPFSVMLDGETAFTYPKEDDFEYSVPGISGLSYNSDTISIMNPTSTWESMSFSVENGSTSAFAATITEQEDNVVAQEDTAGFCYNVWTSSQNIVMTDLIVGGVNTVDIEPQFNECANFEIKGASGYFTDEAKTEVVFELEYQFSLTLDLSMTADIFTTGSGDDSYLHIDSGYCGNKYFGGNCDQTTPCEGDVMEPCNIDSVYIQVKGVNGEPTFTFTSMFFVIATVTFRKDSVTIDDMTVTLLPNPIGNVEATFSASGSCSILGIGVPIPTESSSNAMIGTGIEIAISSVVNMFDGWLNTQSFTIPL